VAKSMGPGCAFMLTKDQQRFIRVSEQNLQDIPMYSSELLDANAIRNLSIDLESFRIKVSFSQSRSSSSKRDFQARDDGYLLWSLREERKLDKETPVMEESLWKRVAARLGPLARRSPHEMRERFFSKLQHCSDEQKDNLLRTIGQALHPADGSDSVGESETEPVIDSWRGLRVRCMRQQIQEIIFETNCSEEIAIKALLMTSADCSNAIRLVLSDFSDRHRVWIVDEDKLLKTGLKKEIEMFRYSKGVELCARRCEFLRPDSDVITHQ